MTKNLALAHLSDGLLIICTYATRRLAERTGWPLGHKLCVVSENLIFVLRRWHCKVCLIDRGLHE